jgi:F0F1-type ATP synthase membrane subunit b/b'
LALIALTVLTVYNMWQVRTLQSEVHALREEIRKERQTSSLMAQAMQALQQARAALSLADPKAARSALEEAGAAIAGAARSTERQARPALKWLQDQVGALARQLDASKGRAR